MKKTRITILLLLFSASVAWSQTNTFPSSGDVGIGTTNPATKLHIEGTNSIYSRISNSGGNTRLTFGAVTGRNIIYS